VNLPPLSPVVVVVVQDLPGSICLSICVREYIMFVVRLFQIESDVDVAVQCLYYYYYYYYCCSLPAIDLFDKVSDLKTGQLSARKSKRQKGFLFTTHHLNRITIGLSKRRERRVASNKRTY
jgi:hypothetical protein